MRSLVDKHSIKYDIDVSVHGLVQVKETRGTKETKREKEERRKKDEQMCRQQQAGCFTWIRKKRQREKHYKARKNNIFLTRLKGC
jgi:hypothetical protein